MTEISPEAQVLLDRLTRMDPANPRHDKMAIERAITAHLAALGLPARPFVWVVNAQAGSARAAKRAIAARDAASGAMRNDSRGMTWAMAATAKDVAWDAARDAAWDATRVAAWDPTPRAAKDFAWRVAHNAARFTTWREVEAVVRKAAWNDAEFSVSHAALNTASTGVDSAVTAAYWKVLMGMEDFNRLGESGHHAAVYLGIWLPMLDAFEAGLSFYWITPHEVVCVLQPTLAIENGRLHRADGPAVTWPGGEAYYFWHGVRVPAWIIEEPHKISVEEIRNEPNQEIRRCMVEFYGPSRYLKDAGARLIHEDAYGKLWSMPVGDEEWRVVEVVNGTPEPDGSYRIYTLDVTGAERVLGWPIETAQAAVAATYGLRPEEYLPAVRT